MIRKLLTTAANADFESLQYSIRQAHWIRPALARDGDHRTRPSVLLVLGVDDRSATREVPLPQLDEAYSPTWSPDGG